MNIAEIKENPNNPRFITDDKFQKLVKSIKEFPEMLDIRPLVVNQDCMVLGGNMRLKACREAGLTDIPVKMVNLESDKEAEFIVKDNSNFGQWDFEVLANEWDTASLVDWGLDIPEFQIPEQESIPPEDKEQLCPHCGGKI